MISPVEAYFSILMLFGASQAVTGICLLVKDKHRPFSNNLLALLLFAWGFSCYWFFAFIHKGPFFSVAVTTFIGPMLALTLFPPVYLYVKYLFYGYQNFQRTIHLHLSPVYIYIAVTIYLYVDSNMSIDAMRQHEWYHARALASSYFATLQGPFYFIKTNYILKLRQRKLKENYSEIETRKLEGFQIINYSFALVFVIGGLSTIVKVAYLDPYMLYMAYHGVLAISLFSITLMIYKYPNVFKSIRTVPGPYRKDIAKNEVETSEPHKAQLTENTRAEIPNEIVARLEALMEAEKPYRNPNFSLNDLADALSESRNAISYVLNHDLNTTFYTYINEQRVSECKRLLRDVTMQHLTIEGIAAESGFKTMSVFYRFFKETEKMTPAVYRKRAVAKVAQK